MTAGRCECNIMRTVYKTASSLPELPTTSILTAGVLSLLLLPTRLNILQRGFAVSCGQLSCLSSVLKHTGGQ